MTRASRGAAQGGGVPAGRAAEPVLGDLLTVAEVDTVVRLDGPGGLLPELVLTGDVTAGLSEVLAAARGPTGAGFFVVGPFGSGKSHFLAAVGELLGDPDGASRIAGWETSLREAARPARRSLAVRVPLVEYRAAAALEDVATERASRALGLGAPDSGTDRAAHWDRVLDSARRGGHDGLVLLLDELSEFLRAKRGAALTEDLRFLQFLGEWAGERPVVVLAALQESIDEVANVSERELSRIRDRYRPSLTLSMRHVEDLVRGRLVRLAPGAGEWIDKVHAELSAAFPGAPLDRQRLARCYPLHPATLEVLEGLRFLLSQQRGVVDFVCRQVRADLDRPYTHLITPERVFDHFRDRLRERRESARLADAVVPHYERAADEMFDPGDRELALRAVKLLCLLAASPLERPRTASELAGMLLAKVSDVEPAANTAYLESVVLEPLAARGAYVVADAGPPRTYEVAVEADAAIVLRARLSQARAEIHDADRRLVTTLVELGSTPSLPLAFMAQVGFARRDLLWQNTPRSVLVGMARLAEVSAAEAEQLVGHARGSGAEGVLLVAEVELSDEEDSVPQARALAGGQQRVAVWVPDALTADERDALVELHARRRVAEAARSEGRDDLVDLLDRGSDTEVARAREILRRLYFSGSLVARGTGEAPVAAAPDLPSLAGVAFERQLPALADVLLSRLHPRHGEVAPRGELVGDRLVRQIVTDVIAAGRLGAAALERQRLRPLVDGYLAPLGLARTRREGAVVAPDPARSPAVAEALRLVGEGDPVPGPSVVAALADGPFGLTDPESLLVLNACAQAGLLEVWRGPRRLAEPFLALTSADTLVAGELVEPALRESIAALSPAVTGPGPFDPWTSHTQRTAWDYARVWLEAQRENVAQVRAGLVALEDIPALAGADNADALADVVLVEGVVEGCPEQAPAAEGLRRVAAVATGLDPAELLAAGRRVGALARFFRDDLRRIAEAAGYLTSPELTIPEEDERLRMLHTAALALLPQVLRLAAGDRLADMTGAIRELRSAYGASYQKAHDRFYSAVGSRELDAVRSAPAYGALAALAGMGAVAVPDDRVKVDRMLAAAAPAPCTRRVELELMYRPRCICGFGLGDPAPTFDPAAVLAVVERGVGEYLAELSAPEHAARLADAAADLDALGRAEIAADLRRVAELAAGNREGPVAGEAVLTALTGLLTPGVQSLLRDVLGGGQLIVGRDLGALREDLIGRRYPKRRLLELLASWVDPDGALPPTAFVEVRDSTDAQRRGGPGLAAGHPGALPGRAGPPAGSSATASFLGARYPALAGVLPAQQAADAFWLAAWWHGRPGPPSWIPPGLLDDERLLVAAEAALSDPEALEELADLDRRTEPATVLGGQVAAALSLDSADLAGVVAALRGERLLRRPVRAAADQLVRRLAGDWQGVGRMGPIDVREVASRHALLAPGEVVALDHLLEAARHVAEIERRVPGASAAELAEEIYPDHASAVAELVSRAELASAGPSVVGPDAVDFLRARARRVLATADDAFASHAGAGFPGCLAISDVGRVVLEPLLGAYGRVAVLLVDAMRADVARHVVAELRRLSPDREVRWRWAVVPAPTRTAESVAALALGRPVPAGSAAPPTGRSSASGEAPLAPFTHLGREVEVLIHADRDHRAADLRALWESGAPIMVAVASALDERLHRTSTELAGLIDDAVRAVSGRALASLSALPPSVPIVLMADHGFRENPAWGRGPEGRYTHGGTSLEECVVPVVVADVRAAGRPVAGREP